MRKEYEIVYYHKDSGKRETEDYSEKSIAIHRAKQLLEFGYYPVVYNVFKQELVEIDEN